MKSEGDYGFSVGSWEQFHPEFILFLLFILFGVDAWVNMVSISHASVITGELYFQNIGVHAFKPIIGEKPKYIVGVGIVCLDIKVLLL